MHLHAACRVPASELHHISSKARALRSSCSGLMGVCWQAPAGLGAAKADGAPGEPWGAPPPRPVAPAGSGGGMSMSGSAPQALLLLPSECTAPGAVSDLHSGVLRHPRPVAPAGSGGGMSMSGSAPQALLVLQSISVVPGAVSELHSGVLRHPGLQHRQAAGAACPCLAVRPRLCLSCNPDAQHHALSDLHSGVLRPLDL